MCDSVADHFDNRLAFIDRGNIGNAKIAGLYDDLHLHGMQYNTALTLFFVPVSSLLY
jgi:hypothetical protein